MATIIPAATGQPFVVIAANDGEWLSRIERDLVISIYKDHGALLFRGFETNLAEFNYFVSRFCSSSVFNESPNRRVLKDGTQILSVDEGADALELHPELAREPWQPDVCFFFCIDPPQAGGETLICDGVELAAAMPDEVRNVLLGRRLVYTQETGLEQLQFWLGTAWPSEAQLSAPPSNCPYSFSHLDGKVLHSFSRPALHRPMFENRQAFNNFLLFSRFHHQRRDFPVLDDGSCVSDTSLEVIRAKAARLSASINWWRGDLLMLDNTRFMHGRNAIVNPAQRVIASYFGYLDFAIPNSDEMPNAQWRRNAFRPPAQGRVTC